MREKEPALGRFFRFWETQNVPLRTRVYIDGYNLYYGCLRRTPYKWLDLLKLFEDCIFPTVLYRTAPDAPVSIMQLDACAIRYFTAPILSRAAKAEDCINSQRQYHKALESSGRISLTYGYHSLTKSNQYLVDAEDPDRDPKLCAKAQVWKLEEKQTDVNLALSLYDDALNCEELQQLVVVTNDTDIAPALALIRKRRPDLVIGLVIPTRRSPRRRSDGCKPVPLEREANVELRKHASWVRRHITTEELAASQLPTVVSRKNKDAIKPLSWYARPDLLERAMSAATPVRPKSRDFFSWAETESEHLGGQTADRPSRDRCRRWHGDAVYRVLHQGSALQAGRSGMMAKSSYAWPCAPS